MGTHQYLYLLYAYRFVCFHLNTYIHFITLHYTTLQIQYITLHCNIIHYNTIQYITSHTYIHIYVYVYIYMSMSVSIYIYISLYISLYIYLYIYIYIYLLVNQYLVIGLVAAKDFFGGNAQAHPDMWQGPGNTLISNKCKDVEFEAAKLGL